MVSHYSITNTSNDKVDQLIIDSVDVDMDMVRRIFQADRDIEIRKCSLEEENSSVKCYNLIDAIGQYTESYIKRVWRDIPVLTKFLSPTQLEDNYGVELLAAAGSGRVDVVKRILKKDGNMIFVADLMGDTALHLAIRTGHCNVVLELIKTAKKHDQLGRVMVEQNVDGDTVLELASKIGNLEVVTYLYKQNIPKLVRESRMYVDNKVEKYPWELVQQPGYKNLVSKLKHEMKFVRNLEEKSRQEDTIITWDNLFIGIKLNKEKVAMLILKEKPGLIQHSDKNQGGVFHAAAHCGKLSMIHLLVDYIITTNNANSCSELARLMSIKDFLDMNPLGKAIMGSNILAAYYLTELAPQAMFQLNTWGFSPLYHAVIKGYCHLVSFMIDQVFDPSIKERLHSHVTEARLAHAAIKTRHLGMLRVLMKKLPLLSNSLDAKGWKPLSYAASMGYLEHVTILLSNSPNFVSKYDRDGSTPIHKAIGGGHLVIVKEFISQFPQTLCDIDKEGRTTLHIAARYHKANILSYLLEQEDAKYILNLRDREGNTFHDLAKELRNRNSSSKNAPNSGSILKSVINDPNFVAKTTQTSYFGGGSFINHQNDDISSEWGDSNNGVELLAAAEDGRVDVVRRILEDDGDIMLVGDSMGDTALHRASRAGHSEVLSELIRIAKVLDILESTMVDQNVDGDTALHLAIKYGHLQVARCLINECYSIRDVTNKDGKEPFDLAKQYGYQDLVEMLWWHYCSGISDVEMEIVRRDLEKEDEEDMTTLYNLHKAIGLNQEKVVIQILREKPSLSQHNDIYQGTVFHEAVVDGKLGILHRLVDYITTNNRDPCNELAKLMSVQDSYGDNPLHKAIKRGQMSAALYLTEVAPQAMLQLNHLAVSPLYLAIEKGNQELINIIINRDEIFESVKESLFSHAVDACLAHAAIKANHFEILEALMKRLPFLIDSENAKGWKPLSYAASKGYLNQVRFFLTNFPDSINKVDKDGSKPIHKAIAGGHILIVKEFTAQCPQTLCDIDQKGRTTLHIATRYRKAEILSHLLKQKEIKKILNTRDKEGNTFQDLANELKNSGYKDGGSQ